MKKYMKISFILSFVVIIVIAIYTYSILLILPTTSSSGILTLVRTGYPSPHRIMIKQYVDDVIISEYVLDLKIGLRHQQPQKYELPSINEGSIEIDVEIEDGVTHDSNHTFTISCEQGMDLYNNGLLIFLTTDFTSDTYIDGFTYYDQYVYFLNGKERRHYFEKAGSTEWVSVENAPQLKRVTYKSKGIGYSSFECGWKENEWVKIR